MTPTSQPFSIRRSIGQAMAMFVWLFFAATASAEEPEIHVAAGAEELFLGESVEFQVEIRNSKNPKPPDMSAVKRDFEVTVAGDQSRNQSSTFIINGRVTQQNVFSHIYQFQLTPKKAGKLAIPPVTATVDGETLTSSPVAIHVIEPEEQDLVIAEIETSHAKVYPTQPFTVTLRILVQPLPKDSSRDPLSPLRRQPPHVQVNWAEVPAGLSTEKVNQWLQPLLSEDGTGFTLNSFNSSSVSLFDGPRAAVFKLPNRRQTREGLDGDPIRYFQYELARTFTPEKTGTFTFGPAVIKGTFVAGFERNEYQPRRLVTVAPATTVEVREVPSPRPESYCGAIGEFKVNASASPVTLRVGDPLTLSIEFERGRQSGSLDLISAPDLASIPQLTADFDLIDKNPTGRVDGSVKKFSYAMRPRHPNVSIPALAVTTFNPETEKFQTLDTAAIPLTVSEGVALTAGDLVGNRSTAAPTSIKSQAEGIFQNITDPGEVRDEQISLLTWSQASAGIWLLAGVVIAVVTGLRRRSSDPIWLRRQQARRLANRRIVEARQMMASGHAAEAMRHVRLAIVGLVADTRNRIAEGLTPANVDAALAEASISADDRSAVAHLLESIEGAEYGAANSDNAAQTIDQASSLVARIAPRLERGS